MNTLTHKQTPREPGNLPTIVVRVDAHILVVRFDVIIGGNSGQGIEGQSTWPSLHHFLQIMSIHNYIKTRVKKQQGDPDCLALPWRSGPVGPAGAWNWYKEEPRGPGSWWDRGPLPRVPTAAGSISFFHHRRFLHL